jgi:hypothetical protein
MSFVDAIRAKGSILFWAIAARIMSPESLGYRYRISFADHGRGDGSRRSPTGRPSLCSEAEAKQMMGGTEPGPTRPVASGDAMNDWDERTIQCSLQ